MIISKELLDRWVNYMQNYRNYSENTCISYKLDVEGFLNYIKEHLSYIENISDLTIENIHSWMSNEIQDHNRSQRANARALSGIKNLFGYLSVMESIKVSSDILNMRPPKYPKALPIVMSAEEIKFSQILKLGENIEGDLKWSILCDKAIILLMYGAGLRISEALSVNFIESIDVENMMITIIGKSNKSRVVPMLPIVLNTIMEYMKFCPWIDMSNYKNLNKIFFTKNGKIMSRNYFSNRLRQYAGRYNLKYKISPHSFRHSFATQLLENGASIHEVQKLLGHSQLSSTDIYVKVSNQLLRDMYYSAHPSA